MSAGFAFSLGLFAGFALCLVVEVADSRRRRQLRAMTRDAVARLFARRLHECRDPKVTIRVGDDS